MYVTIFRKTVVHKCEIGGSPASRRIPSNNILLFFQQNFPNSLSDLNPCKKMKIELCEQICRGEEKSYVKREEFVIACPLAEGQ